MLNYCQAILYNNIIMFFDNKLNINNQKTTSIKNVFAIVQLPKSLAGSCPKRGHI